MLGLVQILIGSHQYYLCIKNLKLITLNLKNMYKIKKKTSALILLNYSSYYIIVELAFSLIYLSIVTILIG